MTRALVTAGGGAVRVLSRRRFPDLEADGVESLAGDLADPDAVREACRGVDVVYHTAALAGAWGKRRVFERTNVLGTEHVIAACRAEGVPRLVFTSSPSVVATPDGSAHEGATEAAPYPARYLAHYPRTKAAAERAVLAANGPDLRTCALRPHLLVGPGDPHLLPRVIQRARSGRLRIVGDGTNRVDLTHVANAARAHLQAAQALTPDGPAAGRAYFITQGEPVALWPWIASFLEGLGLAPPRKRIPFRRAYRVGAALEAAWAVLRLPGEPPMTRFVATQLASSHWFDVGAARRDLGYDPERLPLAAAMPELHAYYLEGEGRAVLGER